MFDTINGIPIHPLVVHGVAVLLPLAIVGTLAIVARPAWRRTHGVLVVAIAAIATAMIPVATSSGESLEKHVGDPGKHAALGDQLIWFVLPMLVLVVALVFLDRRDAAATENTSSSSTTGIKVVAALAVVASMAAGFQVYRVGDSGAKAAWCGEGKPAFSCTAAK